MNRLKLVALAAVASLSARAEMRELSFMTAMPVEAAPVVDGRLDDVAWKQGIANCNYYKYLDAMGARFTNLQTRCTIVFDDRGLYTGVVNYDPNVSKIRRTVVRDNDSEIWHDDSAELYFDPAANGVGFYKFVVNANGRNDSCWRMDAANIHDEWRFPGVASAAQVFDDRWELELFVPWEAFGLKGRPDAGSFWTFNHSRFTWLKWGLLSSSAPCAGGTQPQRFGTLYFSDGNAPSPEHILAMLRRRQQPDWGIQIGEKTYLHTLEGTREIACSISELIAQKAAEEKSFDAQCATNIAKVLSTAEAVPPLALPLAGTYDLNPPKEYDGYSGWYRHNADPKMAAEHLEWAKRTAERPRVLFLTQLGGSMRDMVELAARFDMEADIMPAVFNLTGIWEDCVKGGTPLDKCRQIETLLAKNPDVVCITSGGLWAGLPAKYRLEILRRVRDEGLGLVVTEWQMRNFFADRKLKLGRDDRLREYLAATTPGAELNNVAHGETKSGVTPSERDVICFKLGKGKIVHAEIFVQRWETDKPEWILRWAADFESRYAVMFNMLRGAQARDRCVTFGFQKHGEDRTVTAGELNFLAFTANVRGSGLFSRAELRLRLRDQWNNVVRDEVRPLAEGNNALTYGLAGLAGGVYTLDLVASVGGKVDSVALRPLTCVPPIGAVTIGAGQTNVVTRPLGVNATFERAMPEPGVAVWTMRTLPYGETAFVTTNGLNRGARGVPGPTLGKTRFPSKAGALELVLLTANGVRIADAKRVYFFPDWDFEPYTMIMWDNLGCGGEILTPLLAKTTIDAFGYDNHLGESGFRSALFNSRATTIP